MAPAICYVCWQYVCSPYPAVFGSVMVQMSWDDPVPCCYVVNVQSVSWLVDITVGGDFLGLCDQKSSYKHVSDFGRLWSYGHFLIPVHALVWAASYGTSWRVMYSAWWLIVAEAATSNSRSSQPRGSLCCGRRWHFRKSALSTDQFQLKVISWR